MNKIFVKTLFVLLIAILSVFVITACQKSETATTTTSAALPEGVVDMSSVPDGTITQVDFYPQAANISSGVVSGHIGDVFAKNGITVNVWAWSQDRTNAILTAGEDSLPDVMYIPADYRNDMIANGWILDLTPYIDNGYLPHVSGNAKIQVANEFSKQYRSGDPATGKVYGLPTEVGDQEALHSVVDPTDRRALKLRWEQYEAIGAPPMNNFEDVIDVMEQMLQTYTKNASGQYVDDQGRQVYGMLAYTAAGSTTFSPLNAWYWFHGSDSTYRDYLLEVLSYNGSTKSILDEDSLYKEGLKWLNEVYNRGLMDPDSLTNDRATQKPKQDNNLTMIPADDLPGWHPYYYQYLIPGTEIYYHGTSTYGGSNLLAITAKTAKDPAKLKAALAMLDTFANPDALLEIRSGPPGKAKTDTGYFWYLDANNNAFLTDAGYAWTAENGNFANFPLYNGETLKLWGTNMVLNLAEPTLSYGDGQGGKANADSTVWPDSKKALVEDAPMLRAWQETTGYETWTDWLGDKFHASGPYDDIGNYTTNTLVPSNAQLLVRNSLQTTVYQASWQMVTAKTDAEFEQIWTKMVSDCKGLGVVDLQKWLIGVLNEGFKAKAQVEGGSAFQITYTPQ
jgi:hypothetical protein